MDLLLNLWFENRKSWDNSTFLKVNGGRSLGDMCWESDEEIIDLLNSLLLTSVVPTQSQWNLLFDLSIDNLDQLSPYEVDLLRSEMLRDYPDIDPFILEYEHRKENLLKMLHHIVKLRGTKQSLK